MFPYFKVRLGKRRRAYRTSGGPYNRLSIYKGGGLIEIIIHYPERPENQALLAARAAKLHAEYVVQCIEKLDCSAEQKLKLMEAIAQTILDGCREEEKNDRSKGMPKSGTEA